MAARRDNYMALYIVVHHPCDPYQPYANEWDRDTQLLRSIVASVRPEMAFFPICHQLSTW
jgi:hypothetical protein